VIAESEATRHDQRGYALLGMLLALAIIGIMLGSVVPNVQMDVRRDKEEEMLFRGQEMARAIARYYSFNTLNRGLPGPIQLNLQPPYGYLFDLNKLRDGITMGVTEWKFVRPSAMTDPLLNKEWEPVRMGDPRLMNALQAWAGANNLPIPLSYMLLAAPPAKLHIINTGDGTQQSGAPGNVVGAGTQQQGTSGVTPGGSPIQGGTGGQSGGQVGNKQPNQNKDADDDDDDDDDADPLAHLRHSDNKPIVAVAPRLKGKAVHAFWGMTNYEQWVFIYIPPQQLQIQRPGAITNPNRNTGNPGGLQVSP
jgi:type II secretory pathway pseudopilin PulG